MIRIATALVLALLLGREAVAAPKPNRRGSRNWSTVTSEVVAYGDLSRNAGTAGGRAGVPAHPISADRGRCSAAHTDALRPYDLSRTSTPAG